MDIAAVARAAGFDTDRLPAGYFRKFMSNAPRAVSGHDLKDISASERRRLAWHLPEDFNSRSPDEQEEILDWVRTVIISGATDYRLCVSEPF